MDEGRIGMRYANALYDASSEKQKEDLVYQDISELQKVWKSSAEFKSFYTDPVLHDSKKCAVLDQLFSGKMQELTLSLLKLLIQNKREEALDQILIAFNDIYRKKKNIRTIIVSTAVPLDDQSQQKLKKLMQEKYQSDILLESNINPDLIGGFVLEIDDQQYDASVARQLNQIKRTLSETTTY